MDMNNDSVVFNIRKLGAIKNSSFSLKKFMVFSGESGVGKSYTSFLVHYLYVLLTDKRLDGFFLSIGLNFEDIVSNCEDKEQRKFSFNLSTLQDWIKDDVILYLRFLIGNEQLVGDVGIDFLLEENQFEFKCSQEIISVGDKTEIYNLLSMNEDMTVRIPQVTHEWGVFPLTLLLRMYLRNKVLEKTKINSTFLLPPSRGALVGLGSTGKISAMSTAGMYQEFLENMDVIENFTNHTDKLSVSQDALCLIRDILRGEIEKENSKLYYLIENEERIPISAAASSVKELTPLFLLLKNKVVEQFSILFEEPEAHLHPSMQLKLAEIIVFLLNIGAHFQVTSHSDYFLRRINDFVKLHKLKLSLPEEEYKTVCDNLGFNDKLTLDPNDIGAFILERNNDGSVKIIKQEVDLGVPFDTFNSVINKDIYNSIQLGDYIEEL